MKLQKLLRTQSSFREANQLSSCFIKLVIVQIIVLVVYSLTQQEYIRWELNSPADMA